MPLFALKGKLVSYDTETTGLNPWNSAVYKKHGMQPARPFAFAFHDGTGNSAYIRWEVDPKTRQVIWKRNDIQMMDEVLGDPDRVKVGHNLVFDIRMTRLSGIRFNWDKVEDTMFMARILTGGSFFTYKLKPLAKLWLDIGDEDQEDLLKSVLKARRMGSKSGWAIANKETHGAEYTKSDYWLGDQDLCKKYALNDTERVLLLYLGMKDKLAKEPRLQEIYDIEVRLMKEVYRAEARGVRVLQDKLKSLRKFYAEYCEHWKKEVCKHGGKGLNLNSPKQLVTVFCFQKNYATKKRTDAGNPSIDAAELSRLSKKDPLAKAILEVKAGSSMITKFIDSYERFMAPQEGLMVLHPSFHQMGTNTGRFSCSDPNLEQVAAEDSAKKKADIGLKPREAIGARPGHFLYLPDYSQMEVWVFAFAAQDPILMKALLSGEDIHTAVAKPIWDGRPDYLENVKLYRKKGKTMMFLKQYGGTSKAAAELLDCTRDEAQETIDEFDYKFPGVNMFVESMARKAEEQGYIENAFGRQYFLDRNYSYKSVNYFVQGTCADFLKRAMLRMSSYFRMHCRPTTRWLLPLHDELYTEVHKMDHSVFLQKKIVQLMQVDSKKIGLPVPIPVTMKISDGLWSDAKEVKL